MSGLKFSKRQQTGNKIIDVQEYKETFSKRNKYNAKIKEYNGRKYHSALEANYAMELDLRKKAGEIKKIIPQYKIDIRVKGKHICNYYMDFRLDMPDNSIEMHEVKGMETDLWRIKWKLSIALNPQWKFILIK